MQSTYPLESTRRTPLQAIFEWKISWNTTT